MKHQTFGEHYTNAVTAMDLCAIPPEALMLGLPKWPDTEVFENGWVVRCDKHGRPLPAEYAMARLSYVVDADRKAVPCGRWVRKTIGFAPVCGPKRAKPRWRMEWRR